MYSYGLESQLRENLNFVFHMALFSSSFLIYLFPRLDGTTKRKSILYVFPKKGLYLFFYLSTFISSLLCYDTERS